MQVTIAQVISAAIVVVAAAIIYYFIVQQTWGTPVAPPEIPVELTPLFLAWRPRWRR